MLSAKRNSLNDHPLYRTTMCYTDGMQPPIHSFIHSLNQHHKYFWNTESLTVEEHERTFKTKQIAMRNCTAPSISFASLALSFISEPATHASKSNPRWLHFTDSEEEGQMQRNAICFRCSLWRTTIQCHSEGLSRVYCSCRCLCCNSAWPAVTNKRPSMVLWAATCADAAKKASEDF